MKNKNRDKRIRPDDYFKWGPWEIARFGNWGWIRLDETKSEREARILAWAERYPGLVTEINDQVVRIAQMVTQFPPEQLLCRAWHEYCNIVVGFNGDDEKDKKMSDAYRMIDYVQSVIAGVKPSLPYTDNITNADWSKLKEEVQSLFMKLSCDYQLLLMAHGQLNDPDYDANMEFFRIQAELLWMNVRGKRYEVHERQALLDVLSPHSEILLHLFGLDAQSLVDEIVKIRTKQATGIFESWNDLSRLYEDVMAKTKIISEKTSIIDTEILIEKTLEYEQFTKRRDKITGEMFGLDLFDVEKITHIPKKFIAELAWRPGEDQEFFAPDGDSFCGWPLRIWPTMKRPFIQLNDRILSFDRHSLFDNFYRVLQRVVCRLKPEYKKNWNIHQKSVSEELPFKYFKQILPDAQIYNHIYYALGSKGNRGETDGILIYEDHLFVIEVKAGAFTYTSPTTDLPAHIKSVKSLVAKPLSQGNRLVDLLEDKDEISLYNEKGEEILCLCRSHFRHITVCAVTLDSFTEIAAKHQHLQNMNIDVGARSTWVLSIDDLRVYADLFNNPLIFLHYVEQRMRAAIPPSIDLDDEYEHLGLYFIHNDYRRFAERILKDNPDTRLTFPGYKKSIDEYFSCIARGEHGTIPRQDLPPKLEELISFLGNSHIKGRSKLASSLLSLNGKFKNEIDKAIENLFHIKDRSFAMSFEGESPLTLFIWKPSHPRRKDISLQQARKASAAVENKVSRILLELTYSEEGDLIDAHWQRINLDELTQNEKERIIAQGISLRKERVAKTRSQRKIRVNEPCPCGSGKKYKRCCRRLT